MLNIIWLWYCWWCWWYTIHTSRILCIYRVHPPRVWYIHYRCNIRSSHVQYAHTTCITHRDHIHTHTHTHTQSNLNVTRKTLSPIKWYYWLGGISVHHRLVEHLDCQQLIWTYIRILTPFDILMFVQISHHTKLAPISSSYLYFSQ